MVTREFDWDNGNREHIALHGVTPKHCETAFANVVATYLEPGHAEKRWKTYAVVGHRVLIIIWTKRNKRTRVVTAWWKGRRTR